MALRQIGDLIVSYAELVAVLRLRLQEVAAPLEQVDHLLGFPQAYTSKLVNRRRTRIIGRVSLTLLLQGLGLRLAVMVDDQAFEQYRPRLQRARFNHWHAPQPPMSEREIKRAARREMRVHSEDLGDEAVMAAAEHVPSLRRAAVVKMPEPVKKPKPVAKANHGSEGRPGVSVAA
jgi:hypothetical protein